MTNELGSFDNRERIKPKDDESIAEFYTRLRGDEIKGSSKGGYTAAYNCLMNYIERNNNDNTPQNPINFEEDNVRGWCRWMITENGQKPAGGDTYLTKIAQMMGDLKQDNYIGGTGSPFQNVKSNSPFDYEKGAVWIEIEYSKFVDGILDINRPRVFAEVATLAKTGLRLSELVNQDEATINLDHNISTTLADPIPEIADKPNTIRVNSSITAGQEHRGEVRSDSNKKRSHRTIPIDDELCKILAWYLSLRPRSPRESRPLFTGVTTDDRIESQTAGDDIKIFAEKNGWDGESGITPHFFRHWYVTNMRNNLSMIESDKYPGTPAQIVKGLRGDSDDDTIETYSHDWNKGLEADVPPTDDLIRDCIPKFFT